MNKAILKQAFAACVLSMSFETAANASDNAIGRTMNCQSRPFRTGMASYYGKAFHGKKTANGEIYDMFNAHTAAYNGLPFDSWVKVKRTDTGQTAYVRINDTGGFKKYGRIIDVSRAAAANIDLLDDGVTKVQLFMCERR